MAAAQILSPRARARRPLPRWAVWTLLAGAAPLAAVFRSAVAGLPARGDYVSVSPSVLLTLPLSVAACALASWAESRLYRRLWPMRPALRLALTVAAPFGALLATVLLLVAMLAAGSALQFFAPVAVIAGYWAIATCAGSAVTVSVDVLVSAVARHFRSRVLLAVGVLLGIASVGSASLALFSTSLFAKVLRDAQGSKLPSEPHRWLELVRHHPLRVDAVLFVGTALFFVPLAWSAIDKLVEWVTERLHPLSLAFDAVSEGRRDVRVEEAGSAEFVQLGSRFNRMVEGLALAEQMERAFGMYVSSQLMRRIREQHGQAALPASLRAATVLFADIRGFTRMSERLSPEAVVAILNRYFERVVQRVEAHDGYLNKFIGDAVVVVFNGPVDQTDHAARAARCAIDLQRAVAELNAQRAFPELDGPLEVGVGIATGPMVCGNVGGTRQFEYTVIGDTVNLASRLTSSAKAGEVWLNQAAAAQLPAELTAEPLEPIRVKGKAEPVVPFRIWPPPADGIAARSA